MDSFCFLTVVCCIFLLINAAVSEEDDLVETFDVKPGGVVHNFELQQGSFKCEFIYAAQGGTNEKWEMMVEAGDGVYSCTVVRPSGTSYLFFQHFKMKLTGASVEMAEVVGNNDHELGHDEFIVDRSSNEVRSSADHFKSEMARLTVFASAKHTEL